MRSRENKHINGVRVYTTSCFGLVGVGQPLAASSTSGGELLHCHDHILIVYWFIGSVYNMGFSPFPEKGCMNINASQLGFSFVLDCARIV